MSSRMPSAVTSSLRCLLKNVNVINTHIESGPCDKNLAVLKCFRQWVDRSVHQFLHPHSRRCLWATRFREVPQAARDLLQMSQYLLCWQILIRSLKLKEKSIENSLLHKDISTCCPQTQTVSPSPQIPAYDVLVIANFNYLI